MAEFGVLAGGGSSFTESVDGAGVQIPAMGVSLGGTPRTIGYHPSSPMKALKAALPGVAINAVPDGYPAKLRRRHAPPMSRSSLPPSGRPRVWTQLTCRYQAVRKH
jgi:hypothetical protein